MTIDRAAFFAAVRACGVAGKPLRRATVESLEAILDAWTRYPNASLEEIAYTLATARHEAWHPRQRAIRHDIAEIGGPDRPYGQPHPRTGQRYYGRGLVQLTHYGNYAWLGRELGLDLTGEPDLALRKDVSAAALVIGAREGRFTGRKLKDDLPRHPVRARRVVNGDVAENGPVVAAHYEKFLAALQETRRAASARLPWSARLAAFVARRIGRFRLGSSNATSERT